MAVYNNQAFFIGFNSSPFSLKILCQPLLLLNRISQAFSIPRELAIIGQPDSVCHQWSITGIGMCFHSNVGIITTFSHKIDFLNNSNHIV
jgi:hypothetical protein